MFQKPRMRHTLPLLAVALPIFGSSASAEDFSWQVSGGYGESELAPFADTERTRLDATYYFDPVDDSRGPYALAPFLNRSTTSARFRFQRQRAWNMGVTSTACASACSIPRGPKKS